MKSRTVNILKAALVVGTLDGLAGMGLYYRATGRNPLGVFPYIASGVFGKAAFDGRTSMFVAGVLFHYVIALGFTVFFFWLSDRWAGWRRNKLATGILYGLFVWAIMNLLVLPLSNVAHGPFNLTSAVVNAIVLMLTIGLPLAFMVDRFQNRRLPRSRSNRV